VKKSLRGFINFFGLETELRKAKRVTQKRKYRKYSNQILVEAWMNPSICLGLSTFLPILTARLKAEPISYYGTYGGIGTKLKESLRLKFSFYGHIGIRKFKLFSFSKNNDKYQKLAKSLIELNSDPVQFERIAYRDILIGDTVYDSFLRGLNLPTIDLNHPNLIEKLANALLYVDSLYTYFENNSVKAVCIIETTYMLALPGRVATKFGIDVFIITHSRVYRLNSEEYIGFHEFRKYKGIFEILPNHVKNWGMEQAKISLKSKMEKAGFKLNADVSFSHFQKGKHFQIRKPVKLLVSAHDFFDSPHRVGYAFFSDFYLWLSFLKEVALKEDYEWVIRPHPNARKWNSEVLADIFAGVPCVTILSSKIPNSDLLKMDFSAVLTVFGTVGSEWPLYGVPVINASSDHKHVNIPGNITPATKDEYVSVMHNLATSHFMEHSTEDSWCSYIFMKDIFMQNSFNTPFFKNLVNDMNLDLDWIQRRGFDWDIAYRILSEKQYQPTLISNAFDTFLDSKEYFLNRTHFNLAKEISDYKSFQ
jgi:hypothetical protein